MSEFNPRILHFADAHVGKKTHGKMEGGINTRVADQRASLLEVAQVAERQSADLALFAGDLFDHTNPSPTQQRIAVDAVKEIASAAPVWMTTGNHEHPVSAGRRHALDVFREVNRVRVFDEPGYHLFGPDLQKRTEGQMQAGEGLVLCALPWPLKRFAGPDRSVKELYLDVIADAAAAAERFGVPALALGHFTVSGSLPSGSEKSLKMGSEVVFSPGDFQRLDYAALGHIHKAQNLADQTDPSATPVVYPSSPERLSFGEEGEKKGVVAFDLSRPSEMEFVRTGARPFHTVEADVRGEENPTESLIEEIGNISSAIVRVRYQAEEGQAIDGEQVRGALSSAHSIDSIDRRVERERSQRGSGISADTSLEDQIRAYAESRDLSEVAGDMVECMNETVLQ